jgi:hypothetical protein
MVSDTLAFLQSHPRKSLLEDYPDDGAAKLFQDYDVFSSHRVELMIHSGTEKDNVNYA